ncbi:TlpA family protein disulfide reductase [Luteibacter sp. 9135]|uniref:TlpA family protein disulfide reductase n=1 Tax=Luteibacter sp. 9135 TaxID=1500893 RepID=UPI000568D1BE|nr:TlpA disulfide reductase family protein [Luteibacter sp. 9135]
MTRGPTFWIVVLAIAGAALGGYVEHRLQDPPPPEGVTVAGPGDLPPDAVYVGLDGTAHRLSEWRGKRILVNFWASWCAPCRREMPLLDAAHDRTGARASGVVILGVAEDTATDVRRYLAQQPVAYPILLIDGQAPGGSLSLGNTRRVLPYSVLIGEDGRILKRRVGALSQTDIDAWLAP